MKYYRKIMKIKKNDLVKIISGNFKNKIGKIACVYPRENKIQIEKIGFYKKHLRPKLYRNHPEGGIIKFSKKIDISNVLFYSKKFNRSFRIGYKIDFKKNRYRIFKGKNVPIEFFI